MTIRQFLAFTFVALTCFSASLAAEITGTWTSEFDSQIGVQKYVYVFVAEGEKVTGTATYDHSMGKGESKLKDVKLENDAVSFVETVSLEGFELIITYSGTISGDQMALKRVVGDFGTEQIVAKRQKPSASSDGK
jgi:hypothetical protein